MTNPYREAQQPASEEKITSAKEEQWKEAVATAYQTAQKLRNILIEICYLNVGRRLNHLRSALELAARAEKMYTDLINSGFSQTDL